MSGQAYEMYRATTLGKALAEVLDQYVDDGLITKQLAMKMLTTYDKNINASLRDLTKHKVHFVASKLVAYRFCDNVWTFMMNDVHFNDSTRCFDNLDGVKKLKFVACDGRGSELIQRKALGHL